MKKLSDYNPFRIFDKLGVCMNLQTKSELTSSDAKEVWDKVADGFKWAIWLVGFGLCFLTICYGISLIKWW